MTRSNGRVARGATDRLQPDGWVIHLLLALLERLDSIGDSWLSASRLVHGYAVAVQAELPFDTNHACGGGTPATGAGEAGDGRGADTEGGREAFAEVSAEGEVLV